MANVPRTSKDALQEIAMPRLKKDQNIAGVLLEKYRHIDMWKLVQFLNKSQLSKAYVTHLFRIAKKKKKTIQVCLRRQHHGC